MKLSVFDSRSSAQRIGFTFFLSLIAAVVQAYFFVSVGSLIDGASTDGASVWPAVITGVMTALLYAWGAYSAEVGAKQAEGDLRPLLLKAWWNAIARDREHKSSGSTVSLLTEGVEKVTYYRHTFLGKMVGAGISPLAVLVVIAVELDWVAALILLALIPLIPVVIGGFQRLFAAASTQSRKARGRLADRYLESIQGLETLVMLGAVRRTEQGLADVGEENRIALMKLLSRNQIVIFVSDAIFTLVCISAAAVIAGWRMSAGVLTLGEAVALLLCSFLLTAPLELVGAFFYIAMGGRGNQRAMKRVGLSSHLKSVNGTETTTAGAVELRGVSLQQSSGKPVLQDVTLTITPKETVIIHGPSGGGKTTLLDAMKGFITISEGGIAVSDSVDLRSNSAYVAQSTWLFSGSIAENLRLVAPTAPDEQLWQALEEVGLAEEVRAFPQKLDTDVGERGGALSGGQAQRLSLARAILSGRDIILLDEPTSQVDSAAERAIVEALEKLSGTATIVLVTHRRSTLISGARELTVDNGTVTETLKTPESASKEEVRS